MLVVIALALTMRSVAVTAAPRPNVQDYLARIRLNTPADQLPPTLETLAAVHRAHMRAVPFENLDLFAGIPVRVDAVEHPWRKLVGARRGGWCHEHTLVAAEALGQLGFDVTVVSGHVIVRGEDASPEGTHALAVATGGRLGSRKFVVDVGYPDAALEPLCADDEALGTVQWSSTGRAFMITRQVSGGVPYLYRWSLPPGSGHTPESPPEASDFEPSWRFREDDQPDPTRFCAGNDWVQTAEQSVFRKNLLVTLPRDPGGRVTLSGRRLIETDAAWRKTRREVDDAELVEILEREFGIVWPDLLSGQSAVAESPIAAMCA
mmetsp:Transcript_5339/g.18049  ORF Transcript_5339/g.18049 Transcript_5339/m.18049 type:complete len:320 (-) Transcript_5339:197-1156(-)